jgi:predicted deacylase
LLFEGGEALRFDEVAIRAGAMGILRVMKRLGMIIASEISASRLASAVSHSSTWLRAPEGGILRTKIVPGDRIDKGEIVGEITDPLGDKPVPFVSQERGIVIGRTNLPIVHRGDALFHLARVKDTDARERIGRIEGELVHAPLFDEDEII